MLSLLGDFGPWLLGLLSLLGGAFFVGKKVSDGKHTKAENDALREVIEDAQEHAARRADDSDDPKQRLRDQSNSG